MSATPTTGRNRRLSNRRGFVPAPRKILSDSELAAYRRDGFLVPEYRLPLVECRAASSFDRLGMREINELQ